MLSVFAEIGSATIPEQLTVRLDAVDCLTYLEYVEAMRRSNSSAEFLDNLKIVRYQDGKVEYGKRNGISIDVKKEAELFDSIRLTKMTTTTVIKTACICSLP
jgi:hypothetical protein